MDGQKYENSGQLVILFSPKTGLFHCLADRLQHQLLHDEIGLGVGVAAVVAELFREGVVLVGQGGVVIHIDDAVGPGVLFKALVDLDDGLGGVLDVGVPHEGGAGWDRGDERHDVVGSGQLAHGHDIVHHLGWFHPIGVVCHVVGARHDDHRLGVEVDDIGGEACQHLRRSLSADAPAAIVVLAEEVGVVVGPVLGDGVPHEDHLGEVAALGNALIVSPEAVEPEPILL